MIQKTLGIIKPDATKRKLTGRILSDLEETELTITGLKMVKLTEDIAKEFYAEHSEKGFFNELIEFMTSHEVVVFALEGENAVKRYREIMGTTNPDNAADGTLRKKYALSFSENSVHGSDSEESAERELNIFNL